MNCKCALIFTLFITSLVNAKGTQKLILILDYTTKLSFYFYLNIIDQNILQMNLFALKENQNQNLIPNLGIRSLLITEQFIIFLTQLHHQVCIAISKS